MLAHRPRSTVPALAVLSLAAGCGAPMPRVTSLPSEVRGAVLATIPAGAGPVHLAMGPDATRLFAATRGALLVIDTATSAVQATVAIDTPPGGIAVTPNGRRVLLSTPFAPRLLAIDAAERLAIAPIELALERIPGGYGHVALSWDGEVVYLPNEAHQALVVAGTAAGRAVALPLDMRPTDVAVSPDRRTLWVCGCRSFCREGTIQALDAATHRVTAAIRVGPSPTRIAVSPDGTRAYTANLADATVSVVDLPRGATTGTIRVGGHPAGLALSRDGSQLWVTSLARGDVAVIDTATRTVRAAAHLARAARDIVLAPDGRRAWISTADAVLVVDPAAVLRRGD